MSKRLSVTVVNTLVMVWLAMLPPLEQQEAVLRLGFIPARVAQLTNARAIEVPVVMELPAQNPNVRQAPQVVKKVELPPSRLQIIVSVFTTMFLHGGWMHLLG